MPTDRLFSYIVTTDELLAATGDTAWLQAMLDAEAALARAEAAAGVIPAGAAEEICNNATAELFDPESIGRAAREGGNPVIPLVNFLTELVGPDARGCVHWGATSQDILDTASSLVARRAGEIIARDLARLAGACADLAVAHRSTLMVGRTLLQPALPITFGFKAAGWLDAVTDCRVALTSCLSRLSSQLGGAAGTLASLGESGPAVAGAFARELALAEPVLPWHSARQRSAELGGVLGTLAATCAKISGDVALMMQAEVAEAFEPAAPGRGGSSTLPHKRNPVGAAAVGSAARRAVALAGVMIGAVEGEHERHLSSWPSEWQTLGELLALAGGAVARTADTVGGLEVDPDAMAANVARVGGSLVAERVSLALAQRMGRAEAKNAVARAAGRAKDATAGELASALMEDPEVASRLGPGELDELLRPAGYLGSVDVWIDRALARHRAQGDVGASAGAGAGAAPADERP